MRPALLVVASLLAGCREGIELEILADSTTIRVEVFLAAHAPLGDVTELAPENAERIEGIAFPRNLTPDGAIEPPFIATVGADHRARLELQADDDHTVIRALITVGFDANGTLVSAAVLNDVDVSGTPLRVVVELAPVSGEVLEAGVASAQVWARREYADAGCVGITTVDPDTRVPATQFIVTEGDPDCDLKIAPFDASSAPSAAQTECDDRAYLSRADLGGTVLQPDAQGTCRPFTNVCVDGVGIQPGTSEAVCLPDALCVSECANGNVPGCIDALRTSDMTFARLVCSVPVKPDGTPGPASLCAGTTAATTDLGNMFTGGVECKDLKFATVTAGTTTLDFRDELVLAEAILGTVPASIATVIVTTDVPATSACTFVLTPEAASINVGTAPPQVAAIRTTNARDDVLVLPVRVDRVGCPEGNPIPITCRYVAGPAAAMDGIEVCAGPP